MRPTTVFLSSALLGFALQPPRATVVDAGTARRMEVEDLVQACDMALEARVLSKRARLDARGLVVSEHVLEVSRAFVGAERGLVTASLPGGVLPDGSGMVLPGMPRLEPGREYILFLSRPDEHGMRMPAGLAQGALRVVRDARGGRRVARELEDLALVEDGALAPAEQGSEHDYAAFVARIEAAKSLRSARGGDGE
ncbi:MAG: hypothetical protein RL112_2178 [Planctomycetota bacterium]